MTEEGSASSNPFALLENEDGETYETVVPKRKTGTNKQTKTVETDPTELPTKTYEDYLKEQGLKERTADQRQFQYGLLDDGGSDDELAFKGSKKKKKKKKGKKAKKMLKVDVRMEGGYDDNGRKRRGTSGRGRGRGRGGRGRGRGRGGFQQRDGDGKERANNGTLQNNQPMNIREQPNEHKAASSDATGPSSRIETTQTDTSATDDNGFRQPSRNQSSSWSTVKPSRNPKGDRNRNFRDQNRKVRRGGYNNRNNNRRNEGDSKPSGKPKKAFSLGKKAFSLGEDDFPAL